MTIEEILAAFPAKHDIASAIGLQPRTAPAADLLTALGIFGTGVILGAGLALLFAPKAGHETRHDIAETVGELGEQLRTQVTHPAPPTNGANV